MIYCVVPQALADELYDKLADYYRDDPHVEVIIDRRAQGGKPGDHHSFEDRRRPEGGKPGDHPGYEDRRRKRPGGSFPKIEPPA